MTPDQKRAIERLAEASGETIETMTAIVKAMESFGRQLAVSLDDLAAAVEALAESRADVEIEARNTAKRRRKRQRCAVDQWPLHPRDTHRRQAPPRNRSRSEPGGKWQAKRS